MNFIDLGINEKLTDGLKKQGINEPTYIQQKVIPAMLAGKDIIAQSETGSGKTLAYILPVFMRADTSVRSTQALILTPTHELAVQVHKQLKVLAENSGSDVTGALIIGGANIERQIEKLKNTKPPVVIGSAGRILELIKKRKIQAHTVKTVIIDEADKMVDEMNINALRDVLKTTLKQKQVIMLSASMGEKARKAAKEFMQNPVIIEREKILIPPNIKHYYITAEKRDGIVVLRKIIAGERPEKIIVFINRPDNIEVLCEKLNFHGIAAGGIYGTAHKNDRKNTMDAFRDGKINVLVASDIGARGLDFEGVDYVINLDVPEEAVFYQHRAGRTGRNGASGIVVTVVTPKEKRFITMYEHKLGIKFEEKIMHYGKITDITAEEKKAITEKIIKRADERKKSNSEKDTGKRVKTTNDKSKGRNKK